MDKIQIHFQNGNLILETPKKLAAETWLVFDERIGAHRCSAYHYKELILSLKKAGVNFEDCAKNYQELTLKLTLPFKPYSYQKEAVYTWSKQKNGILVLPTGAGKSVLAAMIISKIQRSSIILVPTIELLIQWHKNLTQSFGVDIGMLGGGHKEILPITVSTYDSARIYQNQIGNQFCFMVFDECHHLGTEILSQMAKSFLAPYRLGLTATPDEEIYRSELVKEVLGEIVYEKMIQELSGDYLANYQTKTVFVQLTSSEQEEYSHHRNIYWSYRKSCGYFASWQDFIFHAMRSANGRAALKSFARQKQISYFTENKLAKLVELLYKHKKDRVLIFTNDNKTTYKLSNKLLLPVITCDIKSAERKKILENFHSGKWNMLISTRVLNEGVDLPAANVAIVISGNSTVREHVQRLGRILRKQKKKKAFLYELVTAGTSEFFVSQKRKQHLALQQPKAY
jgi:superfamily II DNA or RNA helicase